MLHLNCGTSFLLLFVFLISLVHHHHPDLLHRSDPGPVVDIFFMVFSTVVLKPSFCESLSIYSHLRLGQAHLLEFDYLVFDSHVGSAVECGRFSQLSWLLCTYNIYLLTNKK